VRRAEYALADEAATHPKH